MRHVGSQGVSGRTEWQEALILFIHRTNREGGGPGVSVATTSVRAGLRKYGGAVIAGGAHEHPQC